MKKLYRSSKDKWVGGVLAGIGEYFEIDPTILRLAYIVLILITGIFPGILLYIIAYFIIPDQPDIEIEPEAPRPYNPPEEKTSDESSFPMTMKKPEWPTITIPPQENSINEEPETATLDDLFEDQESEVSLDDLLDD